MAKQRGLPKSKRQYTLRARADGVEATRRRITEAAVVLHGTVGPAATTMSAVAKRAGVTRATLYRHFADEQALFAACSRSWLAEHPRPRTDAWSAIADPRERVATAIRQMYAYYRSGSAMIGNLMRDIGSLPPPIVDNLASYPGEIIAALDAGWTPASNRRLRRAAIGHATAFESWRSLTRGGLTDDEAADLMTILVLNAGRTGERRGLPNEASSTPADA
jgi:AcrR family transcriptional regulator